MLSSYLKAGNHEIKLNYQTRSSSDTHAERAVIYNLKASTTISDNVVVYNPSNETLTFKKVISDNLEDIATDQMCVVNDGMTVHNLPFESSYKHIIFDESFKDYSPTTLSSFFEYCSELETIEGLEHLNTTNVVDMRFMFRLCSELTSLDVSKFNTENVKYMDYMFCCCSSLISLDLTKFNTGNVVSMEGMFSNCSNLTSLDLTKFNTEKVWIMNHMFSGCSNLISLDLSKFNTENVVQMRFMFCECSNLISIDLSKFNTEGVGSMDYMFYGCSNLTSLDLSNFNTKNVWIMDYMFNDCSNLTTIYVSNDFVTTNLINIWGYLFYNCTSLKGAIAYNENKTEYEYANYKNGYFTKLVGKLGDEKIGAVGEVLTADNLDLTDEKDFKAYEAFTTNTASYSRTISDGNTWATLCLPFEVSLVEQNFRAFQLLSITEDAVELKEMENSITAGTPVIIKMNEGANKLEFHVENKAIEPEALTSKATENENCQLVGLYTQKIFSKDADSNCYIVIGDKLMNPAKLLENTNTTSVGSRPFRAYMVDNTSATVSEAKMYSIGDNITAIDNLNAIAGEKSIYYDLQGHCLNEPQKGINIVKRGGKTMKVIIK